MTTKLFELTLTRPGIKKPAARWNLSEGFFQPRHPRSFVSCANLISGHCLEPDLL
jgi:hypothetical protein